MTPRQNAWTGMNWIRQEKRLAIYLRDGMACAYCGESAILGTQLTLDHITPHSNNGTNHETNLVTCCLRCNSARGKRTVKAFARVTAAYLGDGTTGPSIERHVRACAKRDLPLVDAKRRIARHGSSAKVLAKLARG